jgi:hypothetical protein
VSFCEKAGAQTVKYTSGLSLKRQERKIVVHVFNYIKAKNPGKSVSLLVNEAATATDKN